MNYYYIDNNEQKGPFTLEELRSRSIQPKTLVWHQGLSDWAEARNVQGLNGLFGSPPPPPAPDMGHSANDAPKYRSSSPDTTTNVTATKSRSNQAVWIALVSVLAFGLVVAAIYLSSSPVSVNGRDMNQLSEEEIKANLFQMEAASPTNYLTADGNYRVNFASNTIIDGTIYSKASIAGYKNVNLTVKFYSKTDVLLGEDSFLVMDFVKPNGTLAFRHKIQGWWDDIDHWTLTVTSAESY